MAVNDLQGVALCHLPRGEPAWYSPLPARVTALTTLPGSEHLDLGSAPSRASSSYARSRPAGEVSAWGSADVAWGSGLRFRG